MSPKLQILFLTFLHVHLVMCSDPDPILDFCILNREESATVTQCRNSSLVTVEDFVFSCIKFPGKFGQTGLSATSVNANVFLGLNKLGMSFVRADFDVDGINVPHLYPRATEVAFVLEGRVYSGFVDTQNKVFARVLDKGEAMVFPGGLVHFQMNVGDKPATILGSFNSQNPGLLRESSISHFRVRGIRDDLLEKPFRLSSEDMAKLKRRFVPPT